MEAPPDEPYLYSAETFRIRGALFDVYRTLGSGYLESVYQECLGLEFAAREIPFEAGRRLSIRYKGVLLQQGYVADFVCFDQIIIELKSVRAIAPEHRAQTINYLRATGMRLGLLVNFGSAPKLEVERFAL
jgi:GxxExxY protein